MKRIVFLFIICFGLIANGQQKLTDYSKENYKKAVEYYKKKDNKKAIEYFTKVIQSFPKHSNSYLYRGKTYLRAGMYDLAKLDFNYLVTQKQLIDQAYLELSKIESKQNRIKEAKELLNKSIDANPQRAESRYQYGMLMYKIRELDSAEVHLEKAQALAPENNIYTNNLAGVKFTNKKYKDALKLYRSIGGNDYQIKIARCHTMLNQPDSSINILKKLENDPKFGSKAMNELGKLMIQTKEYNKAIDYFKKTLQKEQKTEYYINLSVAYINLKQFKKGIESCETALKLNPNLKNAHYNLGVCYEGINDYIKACESWQEAASLGSEKAIDHLNHPNCQDE